MNKPSRCGTSWRAISGTVIAVALAFAVAGCGGSSPATSAPVTGRSPAPSAASHAGASAPAVAVPKYVASQNARKEVAASACKNDGAKGWLLIGTATNSSSSARSYSIVVDFVSSKGDTVLDTKIVNVRSVPSSASAHWSAIGAPEQANVTCVIRQALAHA
jgi:hypothetical protein